MRFGVNPSVLASGLDAENLYSHLIIEHKGKVLHWDAKAYNVMAILPPDETFKMLNHYLTFVSDVRHDDLFEHFETINTLLSSLDVDMNNMIRILQDKISKIYQLISEEELTLYLKNKITLEIPANVDTVYNPDFEGESSYRERTYLVEDYRRLVVLALAVRFMIPVWGAFIPKATIEFGKDDRELACYRLLSRTWIKQSEATKKLFNFISLNNDGDNTNYSAILNGKGAFAMPEIRLATGLVRRLPMGILSSRQNNDSLVSNIHNYLCDSRTFNQNNRRTGKDITDKFGNFRNDDGRDAPSRMDMYKVLETISSGDVVHLNSDAARIYDLIDLVDPSVRTTMGDEIIAECIARNAHDEDLECRFQESIARWVLAPAITPRAFHNISGKSILEFLSATQVILWHWGFYSLAALMTAKPYILEEDEYALTNNQVRQRPTKELIEELLSFYPYFYASNAANLRDDLEKQKRTSNEALAQIDICVKEMCLNEWIVNPPEGLAILIPAHPQSGRMAVPNDIKTQLVKMMIKIVSRSQWLTK